MHRLPQIWALCQSGEVDIYVARRVAKLSRHLPADRVGVVDRAVARVIGRESAGRVLAVAEAKVIEADPALHDERVEAERRRRYVSSSRTDEYGLRTVIARVEAGDAVWVEATVPGSPRSSPPATPTPPRTSCGRSRSAGSPAPPSCSNCCWSTATPKKNSTWRPSRAAEPGDGVPRRPARRPARPRPVPAGPQGRPLRPPARGRRSTALRRRWPGSRASARCTLTGLQALLARTDLTVKPVLDLSDRVRTTAYEHPESLKERVHLTTGGDYWPYATSTARNVDYDHPTPST